MDQIDSTKKRERLSNKLEPDDFLEEEGPGQPDEPETPRGVPMDDLPTPDGTPDKNDQDSDKNESNPREHDKDSDKNESNPRENDKDSDKNENNPRENEAGQSNPMDVDPQSIDPQEEVVVDEDQPLLQGQPEQIQEQPREVSQMIPLYLKTQTTINYMTGSKGLRIKLFLTNDDLKKDFKKKESEFQLGSINGVAILGNSRIGKSTILNYLFPDASFAVSHDQNVPKTKGIDICNAYLAQKNLLIFDCEGFDNQHNVEIEEFDQDENQYYAQQEAANQGQKKESDSNFKQSIIDRQDVLLMFTLAMYSQVIIFYHTEAVNSSFVTKLEQVAQLILSHGNNKQFKMSYKPVVIFLRRNCSQQNFDKKQFAKDSNETSWQTIQNVFEIQYIPLPPPFQMIDELERAGEKSLDETQDKYQESIEGLRNLIDRKCENKVTHLPQDFDEIQSQMNNLFQYDISKDIQQMLEYIRDRQHKEKMQRLKQNCLQGLFYIAMFVAVVALLIGLTFVIPFIDRFDPQCLEPDWQFSKILMSYPIECLQCNDDLYLSMDQKQCFSKCPYGQRPVNQLTLNRQEHLMCKYCSLDFSDNCLECTSRHQVDGIDQCTAPKPGYYLPDWGNKIPQPCRSKIPGCETCLLNGETCQKCYSTHSLVDGKCRRKCASNERYVESEDSCVSCGDYEHQSEDDDTVCVRKQCSRDRDIISINGLSCIECEDYTAPSPDQTTCVKPTCDENQKILVDGLCEPCKEYQWSIKDPRVCEDIKCPYDHKVTKFKCSECPSGQIQNEANPRECIEFECGKRQRRDVNLKKCVPCNDYEVPDTSVEMTQCHVKVCAKTQRVTKEGYCQSCLRFEYQDPKDHSKCIPRICPKVNQFVNETRDCQDCPDFQVAAPDKISCVDSICPLHQVRTIVGGCQDCNNFHIPAYKQTICKRKDCPKGHEITERGECRKCPQHYGVDTNSFSQKCKKCNDLNCNDCSDDFQVCKGHNQIIQLFDAVQPPRMGDTFTVILVWGVSDSYHPNSKKYCDLDLVYNKNDSKFSGSAGKIPAEVKSHLFNSGHHAFNQLSTLKNGVAFEFMSFAKEGVEVDQMFQFDIDFKRQKMMQFWGNETVPYELFIITTYDSQQNTDQYFSLKTGKYYDIWEHKKNQITFNDSPTRISYIYSDKHFKRDDSIDSKGIFSQMFGTG